MVTVEKGEERKKKQEETELYLEIFTFLKGEKGREKEREKGLKQEW